MTTPLKAPTDAALREAYRRAQLDALGISFEAAMADPAISAGLRRMAAPNRRWAANTVGRGSRRLERLNKDSQ
ncbi:MAG: hypothetical protein JSS57_04455 [Proteobacteria bacterium]|nr:hypothetical protein [Pseudomonadota bacterium]